LNENVLRQDGNGLTLFVKVIPGSSKSQILGIKEERLRIKIAAAPEDGKANDALVSFLSKLLACPKKEIVLKSGEKARLKTIGLPKSCLEKARAALAIFSYAPPLI
jgi:uncharacterized protein (TIGR00251 family)